MKYFLPIFVLLILFESVFGCTYLGMPDPPTEYIAAKTEKIFLGEVLSKKVYEEKLGKEKYIIQRVKFKVEKPLKATTENVIEIYFYEKKHKSSCDIEAPSPEPKEKWVLVLGYDEGDNYRRYVRNPQWLSFKFEPKENPITLEWLEELEKITRNPTTAIYGQFTYYANFNGIDRLNEFVISIEGDYVKKDLTPDKEGRFRLENIPPGKYKIKIRLPFKTQDLYNFEFKNKETVSGSAANEHFFEYETTVRFRDANYNYFVFQNPPND